MVDTPRDKTAIAALFADNTTGNISPQDLRDFMESVHPAHGSYYVSSAIETSIDTINVWKKAAGVTSDINLHRFDGAAALGSPSTYNRLVYTGTPDIHIHGTSSFSSEAAVSNKTLEYGVYYWDDSAGSGQILDHSIVQRRHGSQDVGTGAIHFDVVMETNDWVEFHVRNRTDNTNVTIDYLYMFVMGMFM